MIATIAVITKQKKFSDRGDHSDHMKTTFQRSLNFFSSAIVAIIYMETRL